MDGSFPIVLGFPGGYVTDLPDTARDLAYWLKAENMIFEVAGSARKLGGAAKINSAVITGAPSIMGMFDFWRGAGAASFTQKFVAVTSDSKVYKEDMDGVFDDITGSASITASAIPIFAVAGDLLVIMTSANDTPLKWNMSGDVAALSGSPPVGRGMVYHANRGWFWGVNANQSRLYYSASGNIEDTSGADTGSIDFDPEDGDRLVGVASYKKRLVVFKGPNRGSIHILSGTSPTGADAFSKDVLVRGLPLQSHNSIIQFANDLSFWSDRGIHLFSAVQEFGDFAEADVTRFLKKLFREKINRTQLAKVWGVNYADKSCLLFAYPAAGSSVNNAVLGLSYIRFEEEGLKPFTWSRSCISAAIRRHPTTRNNEVVFGGSDGFARRQDTTDRNIDGDTAYSFRMQTPRLLLAAQDASGKPKGDQPFTLVDMYIRNISSGSSSIQVNLTRDAEPPTTYTFAQTGGGFIFGQSLFGVDEMTDARSQLVYCEPKMSGQARAVQLDILQGGLNEDANLLEIGLEIKPAAVSRAETV